MSESSNKLVPRAAQALRGARRRVYSLADNYLPQGRWSGLAAALVAATHWLVWSALSGLEIGLFACLSLWGILLHLRERDDPRRPPASLAVLAAAALARPEGWLLLVLATADRGPTWWQRLAAADRGWLIAAIGAAAIVVPTLLFYRATGGSFLPTTFAV